MPQGALFKMGEDAPYDNSGRSQPPQPLYCGPRFRLEMVQAATILRSPEGCLREGTFGAAVPKGYWWFVPLNLILCRGAQFRRLLRIGYHQLAAFDFYVLFLRPAV